MPNKLFFLSRSYEYFKSSISDQVQIGEIQYKQFEDGETYQRILTEVEARNIVIIAGTISDKDTLELYDTAAGCAQYGGLSLDLVIPFYGYSTMERAVKYGEIVKAKSRANLLSTVPPTAMGTKIYMVDLHTDGIPYYFDRAINTVHIDALDIWKDWITALNIPGLVIGSTDAGRAKWVEKLAQATHSEAAFVYKRRIDDGKVSLSAINADVHGKVVLVYDDMIRSGGSMIQAIKTYQKEGAKEIYVIATHGLMLDNSCQRILDLGVRHMAITNSHPNALQYKQKGVEIVDISEKILDRLK